eukprot:g620.t1
MTKSASSSSGAAPVLRERATSRKTGADVGAPAARDTTTDASEASLFDAVLPFALVFGGCCLAMIFFEKALKQDPGCGNFLTFTELCFIAVENLPRRISPFSSTSKFLPLVATKKDHFLHAVFFVSMSWLVNYAFSFNIAVPIHTIVRSCNVVATLVLGYLFFNQRYALVQVAASMFVTVGILVGTLADAKVVAACGGSEGIFECLRESMGGGGAAPAAASASPPSAASEGSTSAQQENLVVWSIGIGILLLCLVTQSTLGHIQRRMYDPYLEKGTVSKNELAEEFLYTSSIASLLGCLLFWDEIKVHYGKPLACCLKGVFYLSTRYSALTVNITLSMRKFFTVVFSIIYFQNPWSRQHSIAAVFVFGGGLLYSSGGILLAWLSVGKDRAMEQRETGVEMKKKK